MDACNQHVDYCLMKSTTSAFRQPWERGFLRPREHFPVGPARMVGVQLAGVPLGNRRERQIEDGKADQEVLRFLKRRKTLKAGRERDWNAVLSSHRLAAFLKWEKILMSGLLDFEAGVQFRQSRLAGRKPRMRTYLEDVLSTKSSDTLHTRANPVVRYLKWAADKGIRGFPLNEADVYEYVTIGCQDAAPTYARSFVSSLAFMHHALGCKSAGVCVSSKRIVGAASRQYLNKKKQVQKQPLKVCHVETLERICLGELQMTPHDRIASGFFLYMIYARARHSDAQNSSKLVLDSYWDGAVLRGYLEAEVARTKTSYNLERKTRYLPMVCPIRGVLDRPWGQAWMDVLDEWGPPRGEGKPLLPAPTSAGGWTKTPLKAEDSAAWLRHLLMSAGATYEDVKNYGTHGCKATTLSWAAKFGCRREVRSMLGYHVHGDGGTDLIYGRDNVAAPLRELEAIVLEISRRKFMPDATRSGMFALAREVPDDANQDPHVRGSEGVDGEVQLSSSSSEGSEDEEAPDHLQLEEALEQVMDRWDQKLGPGQSDSLVFFRHLTSRILHWSADEYADKFVCGRDPGNSYLKLDSRPKVFHPACKQCQAKFQAVAKSS